MTLSITNANQGRWTGVAGAAESGDANFSLVLSITQERSLTMDFTKMYYSDPLTFVTAKSRSQPTWLKIITPFDGEDLLPL